MGIPFFGRYLHSRYGSRILKALHKGACDHLCVDFNSLIHRCGRVAASRRVYTSEAELHAAVYACVVHYTKRIIDMVGPKVGTYLAVDGVPPLAKMYQQRHRRYMAVKERRFKEGLKKGRGGGADVNRGVQWNSSDVTPGTAFMHGLSKVMSSQLASMPSVVVSGWEEEDEGEHKIFRHLRETGVVNGENVVIYGLDADMIMLSLMHPENRITLMREKDEVDVDEPRPTDFNYLSIEMLRDAHAEHDDGFILDFVLLCMLLGNDFLPPLSFLSIKNDDIDMLVSTYTKVYSQTRRRIVSRARSGPGSTHIDFAALRSLIVELAAVEDTGMAAACDRYYAARPRRGPDFAEQAWANYPIEHRPPKNMIVPDRPGWRVAYYHHLFKAGVDVSNVTQLYLEGLEWNVRYYVEHRNLRCQWHYEHSYSPTALDCVNYLLANPTGLKPEWEKRHSRVPKITPLIQLLSVLPPEQKKLVPRPYGQVMSDVALRCTHLYPVDFTVHTFLKTAVWECHPSLPAIDVDRIRRAVEQLS